MSCSPKLFIVDDDKLFSMILKKSLVKAGFMDDLATFTNGLDAINYIKEHSAEETKLPNTILLDINMPIMDGWQFLDEFEKLCLALPKGIRIFILSSSIFPADIEKSKQYESVSEYLVKPVAKEKLEEIVSTCA